MTAGSELTPKTIVDRRYRIQCTLGRGGFGRTYLAADERRFGELCVLKEFVPNSQADPVIAQKLRELFQREATILHKLDHPQIPKFFAGFEEDNRLFIAQEYIDGKTYWRLLQERQRRGRTFSQGEIIEWLKHLLGVLDYLHRQNIVHRDISPDNIMLPKGQRAPVLIDFGVVKQMMPQLHLASSSDSDDLIQASVSVGKFGYAPYEQIQMGQCSPRSDLYALAVTAVVLLTGKPPNLLMDAKSLEWQWKQELQLDARLVKILDKMMAEKPQDRYASARTVLQALQPLSTALDLFSPAAIGSPLRKIAPGLEASALQPLQSQETISELMTQVTATTEQFVETQVNSVSHLTSAPARLNQQTSGSTLPTQTESTLLPTQRNLVLASLLIEIPLPRSLSLRSLFSSVQAVVLRFPQDQLGNSRQPLRLSLKQVFVLAVLALLPVGGAIVGVRSSQIASVCGALENCASQRFSQEHYRQVVDQANSAGVLLDQAHTLQDLQFAREQLVEAISQLNTFSSNPNVLTSAQSILPRYQNLLTGLDKNLEKETRAAQLLNRAEAEAQKAAEQTKIAKTPQQYQTAQLQWRRSLATLAAIPDKTFVDDQAAARSQEYTTRLEAVSIKLEAIMPKATPAKVALISQPTPSLIQPPAGTTAPSIPIPSNPAVRPAQPIQTRTVQPTATRSTAAARIRQTNSPRRSAPVAARPPSSHPSPLQMSRQWMAGSVVTSATQTLKNVSIWIEGKRTDADGRSVATLMIQNRSGRGFGFVPLYAESRDGEGNTIRSRVLFTSTADTMLEPGEFLTGQIFLLDRPDSSLVQRLTLVIQESTSGDRIFRVPF